MSEMSIEHKIEMYKHYKQMRAEDLIGVLISRYLREDRDVTAPLKMAAKERVEELEDVNGVSIQA